MKRRGVFLCEFLRFHSQVKVGKGALHLTFFLFLGLVATGAPSLLYGIYGVFTSAARRSWATPSHDVSSRRLHLGPWWRAGAAEGGPKQFPPPLDGSWPIHSASHHLALAKQMETAAAGGVGGGGGAGVSCCCCADEAQPCRPPVTTPRLVSCKVSLTLPLPCRNPYIHISSPLLLQAPVKSGSK